MDLSDYFKQCQQRVNLALENYLPPITTTPRKLHAAMHYAVLNNGKRLRPILVYSSGQLFDVDAACLDTIACAVEFIHCYSLVHDDLPALDNDDLRRGKLTCHKAFDEATAILVGDALQNLAFRILAELQSSAMTATQQLRLIAYLSAACDSSGMVGGQAIDLAATGQSLTEAELEDMHRRKTGALIQASIMMPLLLTPQITTSQWQQMQCYAEHLGLAFQVQDDILDVEGNTDKLGKTQGIDSALGKVTYPMLMGLDAAKNKALQLADAACTILANFGENTQLLQAIANYIVTRSH